MPTAPVQLEVARLLVRSQVAAEPDKHHVSPRSLGIATDLPRCQQNGLRWRPAGSTALARQEHELLRRPGHMTSLLQSLPLLTRLNQKHGRTVRPGRKQFCRRPRTLLEFRHRPLGPVPVAPRKHDVFDLGSISWPPSQNESCLRLEPGFAARSISCNRWTCCCFHIGFKHDQNTFAAHTLHVRSRHSKTTSIAFTLGPNTAIPHLCPHLGVQTDRAKPGLLLSLGVKHSKTTSAAFPFGSRQSNTTPAAFTAGQTQQDHICCFHASVALTLGSRQSKTTSAAFTGGHGRFDTTPGPSGPCLPKKTAVTGPSKSARVPAGPIFPKEY